MFGRRMLILVAVLMGLTALAASVSPPPRTGRDARLAPTPTQSAPPVSAPDSPTAPGVLTRRIDAAKTGRPLRLEVPRGAMLDLTVGVGAPDTVALGELDTEVADPASPAVFQLFADVPGQYPIRLLEANRVLGSVRVRP